MRIIPHNGEPLGEVRPVRFLQAIGLPSERARIVAFGRCNFACPYCMRDSQFVDEKGNALVSREIEDDVIFGKLETAFATGERIRLSGGDPCMHPQDSLRIARWVAERGGKISLCHNGSSPRFIDSMLQYLAYAAIDLKSPREDEFALRAGVAESVAAHSIEKFQEVCRLILGAGIILDVRTCVFSTTTLDDLMSIAGIIAGFGHSNRKFWTIRQYVPVTGLDWRPLPPQTLEEWIAMIAIEYPNLHIGCRTEWYGGYFRHWKDTETNVL